MAAALVHLPLLAACRAVHPDGGGVQGAAVCAAIYMCEHAAEGCSYPSDTCVTTLRVVAGMAVLSLAHLQHGVSLVFLRCFLSWCPRHRADEVFGARGQGAVCGACFVLAGAS